MRITPSGWLIQEGGEVIQMSCGKKPDHFMLAVVPDQEEDLHAFNHHTDEFDDATGLLHAYDEDLPKGIDSIQQALKRADLKLEEGDRVIAYGLVPIRVYEVVEQHGFNLVLTEPKKKKEGKK